MRLCNAAMLRGSLNTIRMAKKSGKGINYKITCGNCGSHVMEYFKSSPGALKRCFIAHISNPNSFIKTDFTKVENKADLENICCPKPQCQILIAVPMTYKDGRLAYRMLTGKFHRQKMK